MSRSLILLFKAKKALFAGWEVGRQGALDVERPKGGAGGAGKLLPWMSLISLGQLACRSIA